MTRKEQIRHAAQEAPMDIYEKSIDSFIKGAEWADKTMIDKACAYLALHYDEVETEDNGIVGWIPKEFIINFRKAMEK